MQLGSVQSSPISLIQPTKQLTMTISSKLSDQTAPDYKPIEVPPQFALDPLFQTYQRQVLNY